MSSLVVKSRSSLVSRTYACPNGFQPTTSYKLFHQSIHFLKEHNDFLLKQSYVLSSICLVGKGWGNTASKTAAPLHPASPPMNLQQ